MKKQHVVYLILIKYVPIYMLTLVGITDYTNLNLQIYERYTNDETNDNNYRGVHLRVYFVRSI